MTNFFPLIPFIHSSFILCMKNEDFMKIAVLNIFIIMIFSYFF